MPSRHITNLVLIGMPGAGKSTIGVILAKRLGLQFVDTDLIIQTEHKQRLQQIIDQQGLERFRQIEEQTLLDLDVSESVIATGGSAIYCQAGITALKKSSCLVYLQVSLGELEQRIADMGQRGLVMQKGQSFSQLYLERTPLYDKYADLKIECDQLKAEHIAALIETQTASYWIQHALFQAPEE